MIPTAFPFPRLRPALALCAGIVLAACGGGPSEAPAPTAITQATFVATYVELRLAAVQNPDGTLQPGQKEEILQRHGVTDDDLLSFVSANGTNPGYMQQVWEEVESRLDSLHLDANPDIRR